MSEAMQTREELKKMVKDLLGLDNGLSEWEIKFLDDMHGWYGDFTEKQAKRIEELWYARF
jgi:hypothetical protein